MATIGVEYGVGAIIKQFNENAAPTYDTGFVVCRLIKADEKLNYNTGNDIYSDNAKEETDTTYSDGTISFDTTKLGISTEEENAIKEKMFGATLSEDGELISGGLDTSPQMGFGYIQMLQVNNKVTYEGKWFYNTVFRPVGDSVETKGKQISWQTKTYTGDINVVEGWGNNNFKAEKKFATLAEAKAWLNGKANISAAE